MLFEIKSPVNGYPKDFLLSVNWMVFPHNWNDVGTAVMSWQLKHITSVLFTSQFITILHFPVHLQWPEACRKGVWALAHALEKFS